MRTGVKYILLPINERKIMKAIISFIPLALLIINCQKEPTVLESSP